MGCTLGNNSAMDTLWGREIRKIRKLMAAVVDHRGGRGWLLLSIPMHFTTWFYSSFIKICLFLLFLGVAWPRDLLWPRTCGKLWQLQAQDFGGLLCWNSGPGPCWYPWWTAGAERLCGTVLTQCRAASRYSQKHEGTVQLRTGRIA